MNDSREQGILAFEEKRYEPPRHQDAEIRSREKIKRI
jgi:hypothetical protein